MNLTPEQLAKLRGEVDIVKSNMQIFSEMLGEMKPGQEEQDDLQLLLVRVFRFLWLGLVASCFRYRICILRLGRCKIGWPNFLA